jgi:hypothetical protein
MKEITKQLRARFAREVRFDVKTLSFRTEQTSELERLKHRLLRELLEEATDPEQNALLRRAANDAAALAWVTKYPLLLFPTLLEEKAREALVRLDRQNRIRNRSLNLLPEAA